jgi:hypothetical protein
LLTQLLLIEKIECQRLFVSFAARCHEGILKVGDSLSIAIDPEGARHSVNITCTEIRLTKRILVDELESNNGGLVVLAGDDVKRLDPDWILANE